MAAMASTPPRQSRPTAGGRVVVGIDDSPAGLAALRGSVSACCTAHARCPVTVVTPGQPGTSWNQAPISRHARGPGRQGRR
jgi:hypothetical protein